MGKRKQVSKPTYAEQKVVSRKYRKTAFKKKHQQNIGYRRY